MTTHSPLLKSVIAKEIRAANGMIPFERFMQLALYHHSEGYYLRSSIDIGKLGDFTTASHLSPLYAQCFAREVKRLLTHMHADTILELGAGSGRFAGDILTQLKQEGMILKHYYIYEVSPTLREKQKILLQEKYAPIADCVIWLTHLPEHFEGVIIANEVLDAIPISCFAITNHKIKEKMVGLVKDEFAFIQTAPREALEIAVRPLLEAHHFTEDYQSEINLQLNTFLQQLNLCMEKGVILFADYGYGESEYYHPQRNRGTLTCFYQHQKHDNPFLHVGEQDITAHVNFTDVISYADQHGMQLGGYTTQAAFLIHNGLSDLSAVLEKNMSEVEKFNLHQAIKKLTFPLEMGERVKIMALTKNVDVTFPAFLVHDRRRDL